jgi:hypothetical protein
MLAFLPRALGGGAAAVKGVKGEKSVKGEKGVPAGGGTPSIHSKERATPPKASAPQERNQTSGSSSRLSVRRRTSWRKSSSAWSASIIRRFSANFSY